jgi:hypothetical protein
VPRRRRDDRRLETALAALVAALNAAGARWAVIGGVAVIARGVRRMTTDLDAVVLGPELAVAAALRTLAVQGFVPRIDDAESFAAAHLVLLLRHEPTGVDVDLSFGWTEFESQAVAASTSATFGRVRAPMARAQDLVVFKAIAGRPRDLEDATALLLMHPDIDVAAARDRIRELAALADAPELVAGFDAVVETTRASPSPVPPTRRRGRRS